MNLFLYESTETAFRSNGIGLLTEATNDEVRETLTGIFELTLQYPISGAVASELTEGRFILAKPNDIASPQPFRIHRVIRHSGGWITVAARHMAYRLKTIVCSPFYAANHATFLGNLKLTAVNGCPFDFWTDINRGMTFDQKAPKDIWTLLGSGEGCFLSDGLGGDYEFDGYTVKIHEQRGVDRGVVIRYGLNLQELEALRGADMGYNGVYPYWFDKDEVLHTLPELMVMHDDYQEGQEQRIATYDATEEMRVYAQTSLDLEAMLRTSGLAELGRLRSENGENSLKVSFVQLSKTEEYRDRTLPDSIAPGDRVRILDPHSGVDQKIRVVEVRYQPSTEQYKSIVLGTPKKTVIQTILSK